MQYHYVWQLVREAVIELTYIPTEDMLVNELTKPLSRHLFEQAIRQANSETLEAYILRADTL